jgi:hypothetical protein
VITKCDVLLEYGLLDDANLWGWSDTTRRQSYFWQDHEDMTGMFAAFMQKCEPATYKNAIEEFPMHAFFGVSATGTPRMRKEAGEEVFERVQPKHVLQPIFWLLALSSMISSQPARPPSEAE